MSLFSKPALNYWFVIIFAPPGNCKSLEQARLSRKIINEYYANEKRYKDRIKPRYLYTNQTLNLKDPLVKKAIGDFKLRFWEDANNLRYCPVKNCWKDIKLHQLHDCDLFADEGATLFPATGKGSDDDMPLWLKKLVAQHRHNGIRIVLLTQDFMGINIAARRCVWKTWYMRKVFGSRDPSPSLPPVRWIWGWYSMREISPELVKKDSVSLVLDIQTNEEKKIALQDLQLIGKPQLHLISRRKCEFYDTTQNVKEYEILREIEHIEVPCNHPECGFVKKTHRLK